MSKLKYIFFILLIVILCKIFYPKQLTASYYTNEAGIYTASGEKFNENKLTCAMRRRDFGKYYKITNRENGKSVVVRHNDFGPNKRLHDKGRVVDLSKQAFKQIAKLDKGVIKIRIKRIR